MGVFSSQPSLEAGGAASLRESPWGAAGRGERSLGNVCISSHRTSHWGCELPNSSCQHPCIKHSSKERQVFAGLPLRTAGVGKGDQWEL